MMEFQTLARARMVEVEVGRREHESRRGVAAAVSLVAEDRVIAAGKMDADLVLAASLQPDAQIGNFVVRAEEPVFGDGELALVRRLGGVDGSIGVFHETGFDSRFRRARNAVDR